MAQEKVPRKATSPRAQQTKHDWSLSAKGFSAPWNCQEGRRRSPESSMGLLSPWVNEREEEEREKKGRRSLTSHGLWEKATR
jgi:hypothetical protein